MSSTPAFNFCEKPTDILLNIMGECNNLSLNLFKKCQKYLKENVLNTTLVF